MKRILQLLKRDENGATLVEYCLLAAVIAIGLISVWRAIGIDLRPIFQYSADTISEQQEASENANNDN